MAEKEKKEKKVSEQPETQPESQEQAQPSADCEAELAAARGAIRKLGGEYVETRSLSLPGGDARTLILCKKISQTPPAYPRNGGKIAKSPLK